MTNDNELTKDPRAELILEVSAAMLGRTVTQSAPMVIDIIAKKIIDELIAKGPPMNYAFSYDGTENAEDAAYVGGWQEANDVVNMFITNHGVVLPNAETE